MTIRARIKGNDLIITADNESRADLADAYRDRSNYGGCIKAEMLVGEGLHEKWEFILPESVGALTDAPILCDCDGLDYPDDGYLTVREDATVAWFPNYMVTDPWVSLRNTGRVTFTIAS